jgi:acetyl esterase
VAVALSSGEGAPSAPERSGLAGVPPALMEFQLTLRPPEAAVSATELLASFDTYINQDGPDPTTIDRVLLREIAGWRVTAEVHRPSGTPPFPLLVHFHGGAFVMGAPSTHRRLGADLAGLGLLTLMVDYRRAPKHRFPAAVEDAVYAINWAREHAEELGGDPRRLVVGGDSAGGNLAAAALATGEAGPVAGAVLAYGLFDVHRALPAISGLVGGPSADSQLYLEPEDMRNLTNDPRLHPERFCDNFPPTLVLVGDRDPTLAESLSLIARLNAAGVTNEAVVIRDGPHGLLQLPTHPSNAAAIEAIRGFVLRHAILSKESGGAGS